MLSSEQDMSIYGTFIGMKDAFPCRVYSRQLVQVCMLSFSNKNMTAKSILMSNKFMLRSNSNDVNIYQDEKPDSI